MTFDFRDITIFALVIIVVWALTRPRGEPRPAAVQPVPAEVTAGGGAHIHNVTAEGARFGKKAG